MANVEKPLVEEERSPGCCDKFATTSGLCCFMNEDEYKHNPITEVVQNDDRRCTDFPCCIILLLCLISEFILIIYADKKGASPKLLIYGYDARTSHVCDSSNAYGSYAIWPDLDHSDITICASNCEFTNDPLNLYVPLVQNRPMKSLYSSISFMDSYCLPTTSTTVPNTFDSQRNTLQRAVGDLETTAWLIFIMSFVCIIISFLYLRMISCIGRLLIIFTIIIVSIGGIMLSWLLIQHGADDIKSEETKSVGQVELAAGILLAVLTVFLILSLWFMRKNIELVVEMLNEASYAIRDMKSTLLFPIFISIIAMCFITFWIIEALLIYSVKVENEEEWPGFFEENPYYTQYTYFNFEFDSKMQDSITWHFIMLLYIPQVIIYFGYMVLAGTFADWYFSLWDDEENKTKRRGNDSAELSASPICESLWRVIRYHLGSLAFGAMIIAIVRVIHAIVTYIQTKILAINASNPLLKCIFCMLQCCLKCCQCIFDKINKEGFIFTTIYGTPYCYSSFTAVKILIQNVARTVMVEGVSSYMEMFSRIAIASLTTGLSVLIMKYNDYYATNLSSFLFPSIVIFVMSYIIAALFMMVFEVAVDTIFLCFLVDEEVHGKAKFANHGLTEMAKFAEKSESNIESGYGSLQHKKTGDESLDYAAI